jgi:hypothetical protein
MSVSDAVERNKHRNKWGSAWLGLCLALAIHVYDEAANDFLSVWNPAVAALRAHLPLVPLPTFSFRLWLGGLVLAVLLLSLLSLMIFRGARWMLPVSYTFALVMLGNGLLHIAATVYLGRPAPGVFSSPLLLAAGGSLLLTSHRYRKRGT